MAAFLKDKNAEKPKKPMTDYQLFCHWMKSDESVGVQDPDTGEAIPLKDLHFTKQQKWFSKCWKGELTFPPGGIKIAGLKFKTLSEMKAYFHSKYNTLQEQWHKEKAAWEKQKVNPSSQNSKNSASTDTMNPTPHPPTHRTHPPYMHLNPPTPPCLHYPPTRLSLGPRKAQGHEDKGPRKLWGREPEEAEGGWFQLDRAFLCVSHEGIH